MEILIVTLTAWFGASCLLAPLVGRLLHEAQMPAVRFGEHSPEDATLAAPRTIELAHGQLD